MSLDSRTLAGAPADPVVDLPTTDAPPLPPTNSAPVPRSNPEKIGLVAAAAIVVSAFLPWLTTSAAFVGTISRSGMSGGFTDGWFTILCGLLLAAFVWVRRPACAILAASAALGLAVYELIYVTGRVTDVTAGGGFVAAAVGSGLWLWLAAALAGVVTTWKHQRPPVAAVVLAVVGVGLLVGLGVNSRVEARDVAAKMERLCPGDITDQVDVLKQLDGEELLDSFEFQALHCTE